MVILTLRAGKDGLVIQRDKRSRKCCLFGYDDFRKLELLCSYSHTRVGNCGVIGIGISWVETAVLLVTEHQDCTAVCLE